MFSTPSLHVFAMARRQWNGLGKFILLMVSLRDCVSAGLMDRNFCLALSVVDLERKISVILDMRLQNGAMQPWPRVLIIGITMYRYLPNAR